MFSVEDWACLFPALIRFTAPITACLNKQAQKCCCSRGGEMKRKTSLVILGMVLSILLGQSLVGMQSGYAHMSFECEISRFNAYMNANDQYTTTFRSWYFGQPMSCQDQCIPQCNGLSGSAWTTCMNNCINSCNSSRYSSFMGAQDALIAAGNQMCPYNIDFCDTARTLRNQCQNGFNTQMAEPVLDANGDIDSVWWDSVFTRYESCRAASGIDFCE